GREDPPGPRDRARARAGGRRRLAVRRLPLRRRPPPLRAGARHAAAAARSHRLRLRRSAPGRAAVPLPRPQLAGAARPRGARALGRVPARPPGPGFGPRLPGPRALRSGPGGGARAARRRSGEAGPARRAGGLARGDRPRRGRGGRGVSAYFGPRAFAFLRALARHNERAWFQAHKADYEAHVRAPFQRLLGDLQPALAAISPHYRADPRPVGGSLFRIQRDTRFSGDKAPYKPWQGARL